MNKKMTPRAILAAVQRQDFPTNWRVYRVMDWFDRVMRLFLITMFLGVPIFTALAAMGQDDPPLLGIAFVFIVEVFGFIWLGDYRRQHDVVNILLPHGLVVGHLGSGKVIFHINYRRVVHMDSESTITMHAEDLRTRYYLYLTFADGTKKIWHCWAHSESLARRIREQVIHDWQAQDAARQSDVAYG